MHSYQTRNKNVKIAKEQHSEWKEYGSQSTVKQTSVSIAYWQICANQQPIRIEDRRHARAWHDLIVSRDYVMKCVYYNPATHYTLVRLLCVSELYTSFKMYSMLSVFTCRGSNFNLIVV